jgi:hypothetical protein
MRQGWRAGLALGLILVAGLLFSRAGCKPDNGLNLSRVRGKVTYMGEPVRWGHILFIPDGSKGTGGPPAMGLISLEGTYSMATEDADDGAVVGIHKVGIVGLEPIPLNGDTGPPDPTKVIAAKAAKVRELLKGRSRPRSQPKPTGATPGKDAEKTRTMTLVDGRTYEIVVPDKVLSPESSGISVKVTPGRNTIDFNVKEDGSVEIERK